MDDIVKLSIYLLVFFKVYVMSKMNKHDGRSIMLKHLLVHIYVPYPTKYSGKIYLIIYYSLRLYGV